MKILKLLKRSGIEMQFSSSGVLWTRFFCCLIHVSGFSADEFSDGVTFATMLEYIDGFFWLIYNEPTADRSPVGWW